MPLSAAPQKRWVLQLGFAPVDRGVTRRGLGFRLQLKGGDLLQDARLQSTGFSGLARALHLNWVSVPKLDLKFGCLRNSCGFRVWGFA